MRIAIKYIEARYDHGDVPTNAPPVDRDIECAPVAGDYVPCDLPGENPEPGLDWNQWLGPAPLRAYHSELSPRGVHKTFPNWRKYREYGGGMVTDWGAHHFDIAQWGLGMDASGPVEITPAAEPNAQSGVRLRYASGTEVIHTSGNGVWFLHSKLPDSSGQVTRKCYRR